MHEPSGMPQAARLATITHRDNAPSSDIRPLSARVAAPEEVRAVTVVQGGLGWQALAERARDGHSASLQSLIAGLAPLVRRICRGVLGARHSELEDAIQESLFAVVRALGAWRAEGELPHYASKITLRVALATRRRVRQEATVHGEDALRAIAAPDWFGEGDAVLNAERAEVLRGLIQTLPSEQAEVLLLRFALGYSVEESAQLMDTPVNTAKTRIRMGKDALRRRISTDARARNLFGGRSK